MKFSRVISFLRVYGAFAEIPFINSPQVSLINCEVCCWINLCARPTLFSTMLSILQQSDWFKQVNKPRNQLPGNTTGNFVMQYWSSPLDTIGVDSIHLISSQLLYLITTLIASSLLLRPPNRRFLRCSWTKWIRIFSSLPHTWDPYDQLTAVS